MNDDEMLGYVIILLALKTCFFIMLVTLFAVCSRDLNSTF